MVAMTPCRRSMKTDALSDKPAAQPAIRNP
jgi:hypothetical protein